MKRLLPLLALFLVLGCNTTDDNGGGENGTRNFNMGFTPFPYAATSQAQQDVYDGLQQDADLIAHHIDNGIPWVEALSGDPFHQNLLNEWQDRLNNTPEGHKIFLSITPLNIARDDMALYRGENPDMPLPSPWDSYELNHPDVKTAYLNYCRRIIQFFDPDWMLIGIETNLLKANATAQWDAYLELHRETYQQLKQEFPQLPIAISLTGVDLLEGYTDSDFSSQIQAMQDLLPFSDFLGISLYPYFSKFLTDEIPEDMFDEIFNLTGSKPIAFTETGYPAQSFSVFNGSLVFNSSTSKQNTYITRLLEACEANNALFAVNFVYWDYDQLWEQIGSPDDVNKMWRDTGLLDENGNERPAYDIWKTWLNKPPSN